MRVQTMVVEADSVLDYLIRYYKPERSCPDPGDAGPVRRSLLDMYKEEYNEDGYVCTSHHDNVTGRFIFWPHKPAH